MNIGVLGVNYKSSELVRRELFAKIAQKFAESSSSSAHVLLSTCNRTELYFSSDNLVQTYCQLLMDLKAIAGKDLDQVFYCYFDKQCFTHLAQVVSGIDSVVFGEAEIQRQVKKSYEYAKQSCSLPFSLHYLFQKCIKIGKEIRTEYRLPKGPVSLEGTLWELSCCFFAGNKSLSVLFVGCSEINRKIIPFFKAKGITDLHLTTRHPEIAKEMIDKQGVRLLPWHEMSRWVDFDIVVSSSPSQEYLLMQGHTSQDFPVQNRLIFDLSLPRSVEPTIEKHSRITLRNIEEIGHFMEQKQKGSLQEGLLIKTKIEEAVSWQLVCYEKKREKDCLYAEREASCGFIGS